MVVKEFNINGKITSDNFYLVSKCLGIKYTILSMICTVVGCCTLEYRFDIKYFPRKFIFLCVLRV